MDTLGLTCTRQGMFYNARWYDPALGRFAAADSLIPGGAQGLDRYAYVNNNPVRYTDPSGHKCVGDTDECTENDGKPVNGAWIPSPDYLSPEILAKTPHGFRVYEFYKQLYQNRQGWWWTIYGRDGHFSIEDFVAMMYGYELDNVADNLSSTMYSDFQEAMSRNAREFCKTAGCDASTSAGIFIHLAYYSQSTQGRAYSSDPDMYVLSDPRVVGGIGVASAILDPGALGHSEWTSGFAPDRPYSVGNGSLYPTPPRAWLDRIPGANPFYILSGCQSLDAWGNKLLYKAWGCHLK